MWIRGQISIWLRTHARARCDADCAETTHAPTAPQEELRHLLHTATVYATNRPAASVASRSRRAIAGFSAPASIRHRQLLAARPGAFIRASLPNPSTS